MRKSLFTLLLIVCTLPLPVGCGKQSTGDGEEDVAAFIVKVTSVEGTTIKATVATNGTLDDLYLCFCSSDMTGDLKALAQAQVTGLADRLEGQLSSGNRYFVFDNLDEYTSYRVIVVGVRSDGTLYGTPKEASAKTGKGALKYVENPAWTVTYCGRGLSAKGEAKELVSVDATSDDRYFTFVYPSDALSTYSSVGQFINDIIGFMDSVIASYNAMGVEMTWKDITLTSSVENQENKLFADGKEQYAFAIGVDENGASTGLYAVSEPFLPQYIAPTETYGRWAGTWTIIGSNLKTTNASISMATTGLSYAVTGFGITNAPTVLTAFDSVTGDMLFYARASVCQWDTEMGQGYIGLYAGVQNAGGKTEPVFGDGYLIARAVMGADSKTAEIRPVDVPLEDGSSKTPVSIGFAVDLPGGVYAYYTENPTFPVKMAKVEQTQ